MCPMLMPILGWGWGALPGRRSPFSFVPAHAGPSSDSLGRRDKTIFEAKKKQARNCNSL